MLTYVCGFSTNKNDKISRHFRIPFDASNTGKNGQFEKGNLWKTSETGRRCVSEFDALRHLYGKSKLFKYNVDKKSKLA